LIFQRESYYRLKMIEICVGEFDGFPEVEKMAGEVRRKGGFAADPRSVLDYLRRESTKTKNGEFVVFGSMIEHCLAELIKGLLELNNDAKVIVDLNRSRIKDGRDTNHPDEDELRARFERLAGRLSFECLSDERLKIFPDFRMR